MGTPIHHSNQTLLSPGQKDSQVVASWKLGSTCDFFWPGLAGTYVDLRWLAITLVEIKFARKSMQVFYRLATQRKSIRKFNLPLLATTCEFDQGFNAVTVFVSSQATAPCHTTFTMSVTPPQKTMAGERLIGSIGITTSLASPAVVLRRPKKWAMICLVCKTTVSVLRKERKKKKSYWSAFSLVGLMSKYWFFTFVKMIWSVFVIKGPSDTAICKQFMFCIDRFRLHSN